MLTLLLISFQSLETEMKKLQNSIQESTQNFDEHLKRLFERRVRAEMAVSQVNKSFTYMTCSFKEPPGPVIALRTKTNTLVLHSMAMTPAPASSLAPPSLAMLSSLPPVHIFLPTRQ